MSIRSLTSGLTQCSRISVHWQRYQDNNIFLKFFIILEISSQSYIRGNILVKGSHYCYKEGVFKGRICSVLEWENNDTCEPSSSHQVE